MKTFPIGGIHPSDCKQYSKDAAIERFPVPASVVIPLAQHIGAPAVAAVKKGDKVLAGQVIATAGGFVSSAIHSSVSGTVTAVDMRPDAQGVMKPCVEIAVEGDEWVEGVDLSPEVVKNINLTPEEIIAKVSAMGIVGMGGATFPTHVKLSIPAGKKAECLIINAVECEPYLTADYRVMLEQGERLLVGARILAKAIGVDKIYVGVENNKPDAIAHLEQLANSYLEVEIVPLKMRYPQGGEKQLIAAVTGREVPSGALPIDVGAVVQNVGTALAVYEAVAKNKPLVERVVTVTGSKLSSPKNLLVRIGTPISALVEYCGGMQGVGKVIAGGPMMGRAVSNVDAPVTKGTSGVLLMPTEESLRQKEGSCIRCAKCVEACPMGLEPYLLSTLTQRNNYEELENHWIADCIECGCCTYSCPSYLPLLDWVRIGKAEVMKRIRERAMAKK